MIPTKYKKYFKILFITKYYEVTILTGKNNFLFPDVKIKSFQKRFPKSSQTASSTKMEKRAHEKNKIQFVVYTYRLTYTISRERNEIATFMRCTNSYLGTYIA